MAFTGDEGTIESLASAKAMIKSYQATQASGFIKGAFYGKNKLMSILNQPNCVGIRYYFGRNSSNQQIIVIVGADANGNDLTNGMILEQGPLCPPICSSPTTAVDA